MGIGSPAKFNNTKATSLKVTKLKLDRGERCWLEFTTGKELHPQNEDVIPERR